MTIVIGIGNPVLTDDGVGLKAAAALRERLPDTPDAAVTQVYGGGMRLMEAMIGYDRAILIDAIVTGGPPGKVWALEPDDLPATRNTHSSHDGSLAAALELGHLTGLRLPDDIRVWAVEAADVESFGEALTPSVNQAVPHVVNQVLDHLRNSQ